MSPLRRNVCLRDTNKCLLTLEGTIDELVWKMTIKGKLR